MASKINWVTCSVILGILAIFAVITAFVLVISPPNLKPAPTITPPASIPSKQFKPEIIPLSTYTPNPTRTVTVMPTDTLAPTWTATATPQYVPPIGKPLPDLVIASIGEPVCKQDVYEEASRSYLTLTVIVRNIGDASTHSFGPFDVGVYILLGQSSYSLTEWADTYGGLIGSPNLTISNLDPNWDRKFTLAIDMKGITNFGVKAVANPGEEFIPEMDRENNMLIKYFSIYCYE